MLFLLRTWILLCAITTAAGWLASWGGQLNRAGYLTTFAVFAAVFVWRWKREAPRFVPPKWAWRFSRPAPFLFMVLALTGIAAGFVQPPVNIDGFSYRIPRVLHWLSEERWHWIHTADVRLNVVATGFDWLSAPLLLLTKSDRSIVAINAISFLLLPGAIYLALHRLGVARRVAWWWMWIIPAGFCYCMQAGSIANDMYAAVFTLSAIGFALRARETGEPKDMWTSMLALGLATGAKQTNLPFALPWLILATGMLPLFMRHKAMSIGVAMLAGLASVLPITVLNLAHGFPWQGFAAGRDYAPPNAFWGIVGNSFWLLFSNLQPPVIPWAGEWNTWREQFLASNWGEPFRSFQTFGYLYRAASEQFSGIGSTVLVLLFISWFAARPSSRFLKKWDFARMTRISIWFGLFVFMAKVGINQAPRYLAPWYPFLISSLLLGAGHLGLLRVKWWRLLVYGVLCLSIGLVALSRQKPLFPVEMLLPLVQSRKDETGLLRKILNSYSFAHAIRYELEPFLREIPAEEKLLGYAVRFGDKEPFLWRPYFSRKVVRVLNSDSPETLRAMGLRYVVVDRSALTTQHDIALVVEPPSPRSGLQNIDQWLAAYDGELITTGDIRVEPDQPPDKIYLVRLRP